MSKLLPISQGLSRRPSRAAGCPKVLYQDTVNVHRELLTSRKAPDA